jgi:hypothetical protein
VSPVILTPLTISSPPEMVRPVMVSIVAVYPDPLSKVIVKVLSLYVNAVTQQAPPPELKILQLLSGPPVISSIVEPVQAFIKACPATLLFLTVVPKSEMITVDPPIPVAPVALFQRVV